MDQGACKVREIHTKPLKINKNGIVGRPMANFVSSFAPEGRFLPLKVPIFHLQAPGAYFWPAPFGMPYPGLANPKSPIFAASK